MLPLARRTLREPPRSVGRGAAGGAEDWVAITAAAGVEGAERHAARGIGDGDRCGRSRRSCSAPTQSPVKVTLDEPPKASPMTQERVWAAVPRMAGPITSSRLPLGS